MPSRPTWNPYQYRRAKDRAGHHGSKADKKRDGIKLEDREEKEVKRGGNGGWRAVTAGEKGGDGGGQVQVSQSLGHFPVEMCVLAAS